MDYEIETTALNFQENFNIFRIRRIMLILEILNKISSIYRDKFLYNIAKKE